MNLPIKINTHYDYEMGVKGGVIAISMTPDDWRIVRAEIDRLTAEVERCKKRTEGVKALKDSLRAG